MDVFHPASYTVDHSLSGVQSHVDLEIAHMWLTQSRDCTKHIHKVKLAVRNVLTIQNTIERRGLGSCTFLPMDGRHLTVVGNSIVSGGH